MSDDIARYNKERWEELAREGVVFSRPILDLTIESARALVDPEGMMGKISGRDVLCLAGGGGQQSAAFGILGANVTVFDICETQLERDREAAEFYSVKVKTHQGDMRDLSLFSDSCFDFIWHGHSLNFVPDALQVFREAARILRIGGKYRMTCTNPLVHGAWERWSGEGYELRYAYIDGAEMADDDPFWEIGKDDGTKVRVRGPREFRHGIGTLINGLIEVGFELLGTWEDGNGDINAEPGSWHHFEAVAPPWLIFWARRKP